MSARPTLYITGGWLALVLLMMAQPDLLRGMAGAGVTLIIVICGKFAIYWVIAETMAGLAREGKQAAPAWYLSALPNANALGGTLVAALIAVLPPLAGLIAFLPIHAGYWIEFTYYSRGYGLCDAFAQFGCSANLLTISTMQFVLRLAYFALLAACIQLALRRMAFAPLLPIILAVTATSIGFWQPGLFEEAIVAQDGIYTNAWMWVGSCMLLGLAGLALLLFILKWCTESEAPGPLYAVLVIWVVALPNVAGLTALGSTIESWLSIFSNTNSYSYFDIIRNGMMLPLQAHFALLYPDASQMYEYPNTAISIFYPDDRQIITNVLYLYTSPLNSIAGWMFFLVVMGSAFWLLWLAALHCLDVARNPAKRLDPQRMHTSRLPAWWRRDV